MLNFSAPALPQVEPPVVLESICLKKIIDFLELNIAIIVSVDDLTANHGVKRRAVHECVTVCSVFGMCSKSANGAVQWLGRQQAETSIPKMRAAIVRECQGKTMKQTFDCSQDASLAHIAVSLVKLYFYLGTKCLDLRKVGRLFAQRTIKYKTILRKLYTVASVLTLVSVLRRTTSASELQLVYPLKPDSPAQFSVEVMLNTEEELEEEQNYERRRREFEQIVTGRRFAVSPCD
jgi:hypothetical protein